MLEGLYRPILNRIALNTLDVPVAIPDVRDAIGEGEKLDPMSLVVHYPLPHRFVVIGKDTDLAVEDMQLDGQGKNLTESDFVTASSNGSLGPIIGSWNQ